MKRCPFCAADIQDAAIFCKHCRRDLSSAEAAAIPAERSVTLTNTPGAGIRTVVLGVLATALLVGLGAVLFSPNRSSTTPPETVALDAEVLFDGIQFRIRNAEGRAWTDIKLEINGPSRAYEYRLEALGAGETVTIGAMQFVNADGSRFNPAHRKPQNLSISANVSSTGMRGIWRGGLK